MTAVAWALVVAAGALVAYAYAGYPLLLALVGAVRHRRPGAAAPAEWPLVSITVPAYNEGATLVGTLTGLLDLDYPEGRRQILVVSDASTDGTDDVVRSFADRGVELLRLPERGGKTAAENAARPHLRGDIVVNTDATIRIPKGSLKALVACFGDPTVGVASGRDVSVARVQDAANIGESGYVSYEMWVRRLETAVDGIVGASGCFYAARKELHMSLVPEALSRDFAAALIAREHGLRAVSVDEAVCFVPRTSSLRSEYRRKVRTFTRGMETLFYKRYLLNPGRYGVFAWMLFSHKICRWAVPPAILGALVATAVLALDSAWARWALGLAVAGLALASLGWLWPEDRAMPRVLSVPAYAAAGNVAVLVAAVKAMRRELNPIWEPTRRA